MARVTFGAICNLRCPYCFNNDPGYLAPPPMTEEQAVLAATTLNLANEVRRVARVMVIGGEPTVWPALPRFMDELVCGDVLELTTNGLDLRALEHIVARYTGHHMQLIISVHDRPYRDLGVLKEHLDVWEGLADRRVEVQYRVMFDGERTEEYLPMIDYLMTHVDPQRHVDHFYIRDDALRSTSSQFRNALWIKRHAPRYFDRFMHDSMYDTGQANYFLRKPCPVNGYMLNFYLKHITGVNCSTDFLGYDASPEEIIQRFVLNPRQLVCMQGFTACNCTLNYDEHRYINIREGRRHGHHGE